MQFTEKRNVMDIFYENYFSHSLYWSRAREIFHVSRDSGLPFTLYMAAILYASWERLKKRSVDTHKAGKKKVGQNAEVMPRPVNSSISRHGGLRQCFCPIAGSNRRVGQPDEVYPRSPGRIY